MISLDEENVETRYHNEPSHELTPENLYESSWALTILERVLLRLKEDYNRAEKSELFEVLVPHLTAEQNRSSYGEIAAKTGMTEGALKMSVLRMRRRCRELLRAEIAETVENAEEIDDEMNYFFLILSR